MNSVPLQGKPLTITVIQACAPTTNAEEAEWFYETLQDLLELKPKKEMYFPYRRQECKSRKSDGTWINRQVQPWSTKGSRAKANSFVKRTHWS